MKTKLFFFAMLASVAASAQTGVTVTPVSAKNNAITFNVSWLNSSRTGTHNSKVWVFIDYRPVTNNVPSGSWERVLVSGTPTATSGTPTRETTTDKGFWLQGTSGSSGTYNATITVTLSNVPAQFNWCAYVSDCPPNVTANNGIYTFHGTPPFTLTASDGATQTVTGTTLSTSALTITPITIMDATACPGEFCPYQGSDLYIDATHLCQQRASGAQNWEAWIKDTRDNELYRIVKMPDDKWWLAQNVKLASYNSATIGAAISGCTKDECGRAYTWAQTYASYAGGSSGSTGNVQGICPSGWLLPVRATFTTLATSISSNAATVCANLRGLNCACTPRTDGYGWASQVVICNGNKTGSADVGSWWYTNDAGREDGFGVDAFKCNVWAVNNEGESGTNAVIRCFRQL
ncbi:MAG: hypothetical protein LBU42_06725 [Prevotellaceae bacterium]|jgi:uncharacterized protein (TIGR02145 family)|nr:hypothetical protein [Prevotellaceae bacterium]